MDDGALLGRADCCAAGEDLGDLWIQLDEHLLLLGDLLIATLDLLVHEAPEVSLCAGVDHAADVAPRQLQDLLLDLREVLEDLAILPQGCPRQQVLDVEPLVAGQLDRLHGIGPELHALVRYQVAQMPHGDGVLGRQEDATVGG